MRAFFISIIFLSSQSVFAQIETLFNIEAKYNHFNGNVGIYDGGEMIYQHSFGFADDNDPINLNTRFDIGSISKQFTAAAILHLQSEGKLTVHDPINEHLGRFAKKEWKKITIHQLLTHTSGIPSLFQTEQGLELVFASDDPISLDQLISLFSKGDLLFKPGEEFSYSNSGYILLAAIIEQMSATTYFEYMQSTLFETYGLYSTNFSTDDQTAKPFYGYLPEQQKKAPVYDKSWLIGASGIYSTLSDLSKWVQLINSEKFLNNELRALFLSPKVNAGGGIQYGYGWQFTSEGIIEHDGGSAAFISFLSFDPANGQHHVMLTNRSFESIYDLGKSGNKIRSLSNEIWNWRNGEHVDIHPEPSQVSIHINSISRMNSEEITFSQTESEGLKVTTHIPLLRKISQTPIENSNTKNKNLIEISRHLENHSFWKFAKYCNGEMKFVAYSGLFRYGFRMMKKQVGEMKTIVPYSIEGDRGFLRMIGNERMLDLVVYFDEEGKVMGVFENGSYPIESPVSLNVYPITATTFWIDGFPYGEISAFLEWNGSEWMLLQYGRTVVL